MITDYKSIKTYARMNKEIKNLLILQGDNYTLYAAKRIEELEAENEAMRKEAEYRAKAAELTAETTAYVGIDRISKLKHRAEVAERALQMACFDKAKTYAPNGQWSELAIKYKSEYIEQAEKERSEEQT